MRVWIDSDVGDNPDDAVALLLAVMHPAIELAGVSTVSGDVEGRAVIACRLVGDEVSVVAGPAVPDAEVVVGIGPLTNLAGLALNQEVTLMGGVVHPLEHRGNVRSIETNFGADPVAAAQMLAGHPCRVVPLDVTRRMTMATDEVAVLRGAHPELAHQLAEWRHEVCLHDPLTLLIAIGEVGFDERVEAVTVDAHGRLLRGHGREHSLVVDADAEGAKARILELLTR